MSGLGQMLTDSAANVVWTHTVKEEELMQSAVSILGCWSWRLVVLTMFVCAGWEGAVRMGRTLWVTSAAGRRFSTSSPRWTSPSGRTMTSAPHAPTSSAESPASTLSVLCHSAARAQPWSQSAEHGGCGFPTGGECGQRQPVLSGGRGL